MNKVILMGRLTKDVELRNAGETTIGRYTIAVDRKYKREGEINADFIPCVVFGKSAEFAEKYFRKGSKVAVVGRIQTGSYTNGDGQKVYTTDVVVEEQEFAESRNSGNANNNHEAGVEAGLSQVNTFVEIPDGDDEDLPFS